jgi:DNA-binding HxlR family transcriptional regulator
MSLDRLLTKSLDVIIRKDLGDAVIQKIETRLSEKGYSLTQAINELDPFDKTLREFFGKDADKIFLKIFNSLFELRKDKQGYPKSFLIKDKNFINMILSTFSNETKRAILSTVSESSLSFPSILKKVPLSQSTGYRIMRSLVDDGLLIETNKGKEDGGARAKSMYKSTVSLLDIKIKKSIIEIEIPFTGEIIKNSRIIAAIMFLFGRPQSDKKMYTKIAD